MKNMIISVYQLFFLCFIQFWKKKTFQSLILIQKFKEMKFVNLEKDKPSLLN